MKRTYKPSNKSKHTAHGFRERMRTTGGRKALNKRRKKGRYQLVVKSERKGHYR